MIRAALVLPFATALLACASPPAAPTGWHEIRTPNFTLLGNVEPAVLRDLAGELAMFHALVGHVTNARLAAPSVPVRLYLFRERKQAEPFISGPAAGMLLPTAPGYYSLIDAERASVETRQILFHEYGHYILRSHRRIDYPRWYDEGLSDFLSTAHQRGDAIIVGPVPSWRIYTLSQERLLAPEELFGDDDPGGRSGPRFYASAWALVHYLNGSSDGRARLARYVSRLVQGEDWRTAYHASFDQSLESLHTAVDAHVAALRSGARLDYHMRADSLPVSRESSEAPVAPAEIAFQLGSIARLAAEESAEESSPKLAFDRARSYFRQSVALDPSHARARAALAWSLARDGDWDESQAQLERAERELTSDPRIGLEVGRIRSLRARKTGAGAAEREAAREALERAAQQSPELPEPHAELGSFLVFADDPRAAIAAFEKARALGAWSPRNELELARQYLKVGEEATAVVLIIPVASDPHGGKLADEARRLLKEIRGEN